MAAAARILVDTHALIWAATETARLSARSVERIQDESVTLFVSAATAWEIATKVRAGRLPQAKELEENFVERVEAAGYILLPIASWMALAYGASGESCA
jgi:PIN domain nuclease of toxin-antitoxin system